MHGDSMQITQLQAIVEIARAGSFRKAAQAVALL